MQYSVFASVSALAMACSAGAAHAQVSVEGEEDDGENVIVVTGSFEGSLARSLDTKRNADVVVEALAAEDIGILPEISVAESLERLPGLAADRDRGNSSQISIRGLGAPLALGTLNGREIATPDANRSVRYDQFPGELINSAIVYKSPKSSLLEGGVAGTIDIHTAKPLDYKDRKITLNARYGYSEIGADLPEADTSAYRGSFSYIDQFAEGTLGVAFGVSGLWQPSSDVRSSQSGFTNSFRDLDGDGEGNDAISFGFGSRVRTGDDGRFGGFLTVQYAPNDDFNLVVDGLYSSLDITNYTQGINIGSLNRFSNPVVDGVVQGGALVAGEVRNVAPELQSTFGGREDTFFSIGGLVEFDLGAADVSLDLSYSHVDFFGQFTAISARPHDVSGGAPSQINNSIVTFDTREGQVEFSLDQDLNNPNSVLVSSLSTPFYRDGTDEIFSAALDVEFPLEIGPFEKLAIGARYRERTKGNLQLSQNGNIAIGDRAPLPTSAIVENPLGSYDGAASSGFLPFFGFDFDTAVALFGGLNPTSNPNGNDQTASWVVDEDVFAGFIEAGFSSDEVSGNIGLRVINTDSTSSSARRFNARGGVNVVEPISVDNSYTDVLPSLNLSYFPSKDFIVRVALARTIARAPIDDLNAGFRRFSFNSDEAFGGNPLLEPFRANQADLTLEWYYGQNSALTISGFYKDLDTYITTSQQAVVDENGATFNFFQPVNGEGGSLAGFEILWQQRLPLPEKMGKAGIYANYAYTSSNIEVPRNFSDDILPLIGLSAHVANVALWYNYSGFEARVNYRYRDDFAREFDGGFGVNDGEGVFDLHLSYKVMENARILFQAQNINQSSVSSYFVDPTRIGRTEDFGRRYWIGFSASF